MIEAADLDKVIGYGELSWGEDEYGPHVVCQLKQNAEGTLPLITLRELMEFTHKQNSIC